MYKIWEFCNKYCTPPSHHKGQSEPVQRSHSVALGAAVHPPAAAGAAQPRSAGAGMSSQGAIAKLMLFPFYRRDPLNILQNISFSCPY